MKRYGIKVSRGHTVNESIGIPVMENMMNVPTLSPFQKAIDVAESLSVEDREELLEILRMRLADNRREQIAANARETLGAVREKRASFGSLEDLKKDLLNDNA